jgi:hypothetical protein
MTLYCFPKPAIACSPSSCYRYHIPLITHQPATPHIHPSAIHIQLLSHPNCCYSADLHSHQWKVTLRKQYRLARHLRLSCRQRPLLVNALRLPLHPIPLQEPFLAQKSCSATPMVVVCACVRVRSVDTLSVMLLTYSVTWFGNICHVILLFVLWICLLSDIDRVRWR